MERVEVGNFYLPWEWSGGYGREGVDEGGWRRGYGVVKENTGGVWRRIKDEMARMERVKKTLLLGIML